MRGVLSIPSVSFIMWYLDTMITLYNTDFLLSKKLCDFCILFCVDYKDGTQNVALPIHNFLWKTTYL